MFMGYSLWQMGKLEFYAIFYRDVVIFKIFTGDGAYV